MLERGDNWFMLSLATRRPSAAYADSFIGATPCAADEGLVLRVAVVDVTDVSLVELETAVRRRRCMTF